MSIKKSQQTLFTYSHYILNLSIDMVSINHMIDAKVETNLWRKKSSDS